MGEEADDVGESVPDYAAEMAAYHAAFAPELRAMVAELPIAAGARVLDLASGDGTYTRWLAPRVGEGGGVWSVDLSAGYLDVARRAAASGPAPGRVLFSVADLERLPFDDGSFDLAWCAQSLFSLPDPVEALRVLSRVVRPGGIVAVLESDTLHQVLLPWPIEVELSLRAAELADLAETSDRPRKFYVGRGLRQVFEAAGLRDCRRRTWAIDRQAPLDPPARAFLAEYLRDLHARARPRLAPEMAERSDRLLDPGSPEFLLDRPDLALTIVEHVVWGMKPVA
jgi:ubiquinone/menaquinone biosynthesis C-methylase UbiE